MSAYGPAIFIARVDGEDLSESEHQTLVSLVGDAAWELRIVDDDNERVEPAIHDYDETEPRSLGVLLYSSYLYGELPEEVRADQDGTWEKMGEELIASMQRRTEGRYAFKFYAVED